MSNASVTPRTEGSSSPVPVSGKRGKKSRRKLYFIFLFILLVGGVFAYRQIHNKREKEKPIPVTVEKAVTKQIIQTVSATGKIQPEVEVRITPEVSGEIIALPFREGDVVKKGDVIIKIKTEVYQAQVKQEEARLTAMRASAEQARAQLSKVEEDYLHQHELFDRHLVSQTDFKAAATSLKVAQNAAAAATAQVQAGEGSLDQTRDQLSKTTIFAPMDGTVSSRSVEIGERVAGSGLYNATEVMRIADLSNMQVRVDVNESEIINVKVGDHVLVSIDSFPDRKFNGVVREIATTAKGLGGAGAQFAGAQSSASDVTNFVVKITITDRDVPLRPGMSATAEIQTKIVENAVTVPIQSVAVRSPKSEKKNKKAATEKSLEAENKTKPAEKKPTDLAKEKTQRVVFVREGDKVRMQTVEIGISDDVSTEITSGLQPGVEVVSGSYTALTRLLQDGATITLNKEPAAKPH